MIQYLFNTDHLTLFERGHPPLLGRVAALPTLSLAVSAISVEEAVRGRLGFLARPLDSSSRQRGYALLVGTVRLLNQLPIVLYDQSCESHYQQLRALRRRIGTQDLRIAAVALANNLTLLTRNRGDFSQVPGLRIEDWSV